MGTDQGKTSNVNALAILGRRARRDDPERGYHDLPTALQTITFGALAGVAMWAILPTLCA